MKKSKWQIEEQENPEAKFTWIYRIINRKGDKEYLAGTAGRIEIGLVHEIVNALNEYSLCQGEGK